VFNDTIPDMAAVRVWGVSYHFTTDVAVGEVFEVQVLRNHDTLCTWTDQVMSTTGDRGARFALCGHTRPMRLDAVLDRGDHLHVRVTMRGPRPFTLGTTDRANTKMRVLIHGYKARINTNRDGQQGKAENRRLPMGSIAPGRNTLLDDIRIFAQQGA
jgi:hypothetical protein